MFLFFCNLISKNMSKINSSTAWVVILMSQRLMNQMPLLTRVCEFKFIVTNVCKECLKFVFTDLILQN